VYEQHLMDALRRRVFIANDVAPGTTKPSTGCNFTPLRKDVMHSGADNERSVP
jgi:hypothetical protein